MAKKTDIEILAPATGKVLPLCETKDEVFSAGTMGQGFGLEPSAEGEIEVVAPVSGTVMMLADTKHAIGIQTADGLEILIHMGIDTVNLKGTPFTVHCEQGSTVQAGEPIATMNLKEIEAHKLAKTIMVIVTNSADKLESLSLDEGEIQAGEPAADAHLKGAGKKKKGKRDYDALATTIIKLVGGKENVNNLIHCITRLRFYLKDESKADTEALKNTDGVIDVMKASGQYQVVIGNEVTNVFDAVMKQLGPLDEDAAAAQPAENDGKNPISRAFGNLIGFITGSMSPVIGVIAASGIIKGILALLTLPQLGSILSVKSTMYMTVSAMADSAFFFLPILVGYSAAKRLGSDPIVAAVIGGCLDLSANHYLGESLQDDVYRWRFPLPVLELHVFDLPDDRCCMAGKEGRRLVERPLAKLPSNDLQPVDHDFGSFNDYFSNYRSDYSRSCERNCRLR